MFVFETKRTLEHKTEDTHNQTKEIETPLYELLSIIIFWLILFGLQAYNGIYSCAVESIRTKYKDKPEKKNFT